jgi:cellulose synthase/poly-beta-1,6-N-acetylglucosamine synthase-like glycosyltransferase
MDSEWLKSIVYFYQQERPYLIIGPVLGFKRGIISEMLALEQLSLVGSTAGAAAFGCPIMCSGANLAYPRHVYPEIAEVYTDTSILSGDDMFAMLALKRFHKKEIKFIKSPEAAVYTELPSSMSDFINQRRRWSAKATNYRDVEVIFVATIVLITCLSLIFYLIVGIITGVWWMFALLFLAKSGVDLLLLTLISHFYKEKRLLIWFPVVQSFYFLYVGFVVLTAWVNLKVWKKRIIAK